MTVLLVRREGPGDVGSIRDVHRAAFGGGEPVEAGLVDALADPHAALTVFAPTDAAFVSLARDLGFTGTTEA